MSTPQHAEMYLCLLDDLNLESNLTLGSFEVRHYTAEELRSLLRGREDEAPSPAEEARLRSYAQYPWAVLERPGTDDGAMDEFARVCASCQLSYAHAGSKSWWPFDKLIRTLHLMKPSTGPVIPCQFYARIDSHIQAGTPIDRVVYGEPIVVTDGPGGDERPYLWEYRLGQDDTGVYDEVDRKLRACLESSAPTDDNARLLVAVHYFEHGDRQLTPFVPLDPFGAIGALMSYEACLEALVMEETERGGIAEKLGKRIPELINDDRDELRRFLHRVFWLRSKAAHGVRHPTEIADLIVRNADSAIPGEQSEAGRPGPYSRLFLKAADFPRLLINLRECARQAIGRSCDQYVER
ncbi:MAG: hypothetical protein GY778_20685 [bacterium]|nr:hypothetical protein [bacterium]